MSEKTPIVYGLPIGEATRRVGATEQFAWAEPFTSTEGPELGARRIRVANGSGLELELLPDRCLDLGRATAWGIPLAWHSGVGFVRNAAPDWLSTFGGGLLATCGLDSFGAAGDDGAVYGLHGDIGGQSARITRVEVTDAAVIVEGEVRQHAALGPRLTLRRRIELPLGETRLLVRDIVANDSAAPCPVMVLYHVNLGWPMIADDTRVDIPSSEVQPRDELSVPGLGVWQQWSAPGDAVIEQALLHQIGDESPAHAVVTTHSAGLRMTVAWSPDTLPALFQWRLPGERDFVLGIEPANCATLGGRAAARQLGILPEIEAGGECEYWLEFRIERP